MTTQTVAEPMVTRAEAGAIARLRSSRMSMLSRTPWVGPWLGKRLWPWTWSLAMVTLARQQIERNPGVSLALTGSTSSATVSPEVRRVGLTYYLGGLLVVAVIVSLAGAAPWPLNVIGLVVTVVVLLPIVLELMALLLNMLIRPGQLTLGHRRRQLIKRGHHVVILTDYVRDPALPAGSGQQLLDRLAVRWKADQTIVLLYPANRGLQRMYAARGAVSDSRWNRRMRFDYRHDDQQPVL